MKKQIMVSNSKGEQRVKDKGPEFPNLFTMAGNLFSSAGDVLREGVERVSEEERNERLQNCHVCPSYDISNNRCYHCGCFLNIKTYIKAWHCPEGRW